MTHVLIISNDIVAEQMAGPGIRCWEFARVLSRAGHTVTLAAPGVGELDVSSFALASYRTEDDIARIAEGHDVLILQGVTVSNYPILPRLDKMFVVDFYDPFPIEVLHQFPDEQAGWQEHLYQLTLSAMNIQAHIGDFFLCASEQQRDFWLGVLAAAGRLNPLTYRADTSFKSLLDVVPFGLPSEQPQHTGSVLRGVYPGIQPDDKIILWNGGIYTWFDPFTLIRAMANVARVEPKARLFFMGARHPNPAVGYTPTTQEAMALARSLDLLDKHVFFNPTWVSYADRQNYLLEADIAVSTHLDLIETRFSFRTRLLDCIWAGLPVISTRGGAMTEFVEQYGLGQVVDYESVEQLTDALLLLLDPANSKETLKPKFERAAQLFAWDYVARPLLNFCASPRKAPDRAQGFLSAGLGADLQQFRQPRSLLAKAWLHLRLRGPVAFLKEVRAYLWWRFIGPR